MEAGSRLAVSRHGKEPVTPVMSEQWDRVNEVFHAALDEDPKNLNRFLEEACGTDRSLRDEVESLLEAHQQAEGVIQTVAVEKAIESLVEQEEQFSPQQIVGPYKIVREIGRGGMGSVYLAERADQEFEKKVALKVVKRGMDTAFVLRRFRNERQILANLDHPNIARLLDGGTTATGLPYFVMEYVEGRPIDAYCDSLKLTIQQRLILFRQVCAAVAYAHRNLVIHRDLKPSNILVPPDGVPKLLDFGIAKVFQPQVEETSATVAGPRLMTPEYASPEQAQGLAVTTLSDIYSLGVVLYELLTGRLPYEVKGGAGPELARIITQTEPKLPSSVVYNVREKENTDVPESISQLREGNPDRLSRRLRGDLDNIAMMALRKEPGRRYQSVEQLSTDIERHLNGFPVLARKDTVVYLATKFVRRNKIAVAAGTFAVLAIFISAIAAGIIQWRANRREKLLQEFGREAARMESIMRYAYTLPLHDVSRETGMVKENLRSLEKEMNQIGAAAYGPGHHALGRGWISLHEYEKAKEHLELSWNKYNYREPQVANALGLTLAMLYQKALAEASRIRSPADREERLKEIEKTFRQPALEYVNKGKAATESPEYVTALILFLEKKYDAALTSTEKALDKIPWLYEARKLEADILRDKANLHGSRGEYDTAIQYYGKAEDAYHKAIETARSDAEIYRDLCGMRNDLLQQKVYETGDDPKETLSKSIAACEQSLVAQPDSAPTYTNLLSIYIVYAYYETWVAEEDARPMIQKGAEAGEHALRLQPENAETERMLGRLYISAAEYDSNHGVDPKQWLEKANHHLNAAIRLNPQVSFAYSNLGLSEYYAGLNEMLNGKDPRGALDRSIRSYHKAIELRPDSAKHYRDLGGIYQLKVEYELDHGIDPRPSVNGTKDALTRAIQLNPKEQAAYFFLGQTFVFQAIFETNHGIDPSKSLESARAHLQKAFEINPTDDYCLVALGWTFLVQADYNAASGIDVRPALEEAEKKIQKALAMAPQRAIGYWYLGMVMSEQSRFQIEQGGNPESTLAKARDVLQKAVKMHPAELADIQIWLGKTELTAAKWAFEQGKSPEAFSKKAIKVLEEAIRANPQSPDAHMVLAQVQVVRAESKLRQGVSADSEITAGLESVEHALSLNPQLAEAFVAKGELLKMQKSIADAEKAFNQAFQINPLLKRTQSR